jgi:hypothetical protein
VFGLARNQRLERALGRDLREAKDASARGHRTVQRFRELTYRPKQSWSRRRRVIGKAEYAGENAAPRFLVTSLSKKTWPAQFQCEDIYCAGGEMENRIGEARLDLFADRLSPATFRSNQLRLWLSSAAYVLMHALRWIGRQDRTLAKACASTILLRLSKIGGVVRA